jgi:hypothetical protein
MSTGHEDDIVRLATASNGAEAHLWEQILRAEGIRCQVVGDYLETGIGDVPGLQPEVWVHRSDLQRAAELIRPRPAPPEPEDEAAG